MLCPKCKKEIDNNSLVCQHCNTKVGSLCKKCNTYNPITSPTCSKCGEVLIKICSECGSANLPSAKYCRKCNIEFVTDVPQNTPEYSSSMNSQQKIKARLLEGIKNANSRIISICGNSGTGKSLVLRHAISELKSVNLIWLLGSCTQISQLSPFGYFQDLLLNFFNINNFCLDSLQFKKNSIKFFKQDFPTLTNNEILDLLNLLYPDNTDNYENIYLNKLKYFSIMKKVIFTIVEKMKVIFIIDHFEYIDGMSFDFIKELLNEEIILNRTKFIILSSNIKPAMGMITSPNLTEKNYLDLTIAPFNQNQVESLIKQYSDTHFGKDFINLVTKISCGNPSVVEQMILLNNEIKRNGLKNFNYNSLDSIMSARLSILKQEDKNAYDLLIAMSILGFKFYPAILENFDNISQQEYNRIVDKLLNTGFISQLNSLSFEFKSADIWKSIVVETKNDIDFEKISNILFEILYAYKQTSVALIAYLLQKLNNNDQAFEVWTLLMKHASYIGDIGLYIITQKQALKLIENKNNDFFKHVKKNIYTRVGKLLEPIDHNASFEFIQNAILMLEDEEDFEHIELLGYLASCSMKSGNYWGAIECIESVLNKLPKEMEFEKTLVKTRLITPLLKLGNYGQLILTVETELLNELEKHLSKGKNTPQIKIDDLFELWLNVYFDYAEALVFEGDNRAFEVIKTIYEIIEQNPTDKPSLTCKTHLLLALANTIKGDIHLSNTILDDILKEYSLDNMDNNIISRWNFIDILNKFFQKDYNALHTELFNVAAFANNINDNFTKNILKTILAKILKENNQTKKALEILEEQVAYFAKEKVATGVLLSWYLIAEIKLITNGTQFALDIATKALDIAQGPNINNYYFIVLFNKLIGEIYMAKQDFDSAKVYLEKALLISKQFDLQYIQVKIYLLCAKLYQELALPKTASRNEYIKKALKMFQNAKNVQIVSNHATLQKNIKEDLNILTSFCKLNGISLKKDKK